MLGMSVGPVKMHLKREVVEKYVVKVNGFIWLMTVSLTLNMVLFISHNTASLYSLFIQADNMFRPMFLDHLRVTRNVCLEEVIQVSHKIKYTQLKFNKTSLSFIL
jgi:hypothetical protein